MNTENINAQSIINQFRTEYGIRLTQEQVSDYISFIEKKGEFAD